MLPEWSDRGAEEVVQKWTGNTEDAFKIWSLGQHEVGDEGHLWPNTFNFVKANAS